MILIDSWNKVYEVTRLDFDTDLRKAYNGKLIFAIFQRTVTRTMRGGAKSQFDGDIIMKIDKGETFKENYVFHDKNRYQNKDLSELKYNTYGQELAGEIIYSETVPYIHIKNDQLNDFWEDIKIKL